MQAAYASDSKESAFEEINTMLTTLGDPYTRLVPSRCAPLFECGRSETVSIVDFASIGRWGKHTIRVVLPVHIEQHNIEH